MLNCNLNYSFVKINKNDLFGEQIYYSQEIEFPLEALQKLAETIEQQMVNIEINIK